jgi:hypothetical protein
MRFCQPHWDQLRDAVRSRGLYDFVASSGKEAVARMAAQFEDASDGKPYDPLMAAHFMIVDRALELGGLYLMTQKEDGSEYCPLCEMEAHGGDPAQWIDGATDFVLAEFQDKGWVGRREGDADDA